jgi:glucose-6-phosphate isomerase
MLSLAYDSSNIKPSQVSALAEQLESVRQRLLGARKEDYQSPESFISLPDDKMAQKQAEEVVNNLRNQELKHVFVIGIGGSSLGAKAVYDLVNSPAWKPPKGDSPRLVFLDTSDPVSLVAAEELISGTHRPEEMAVNIISKSGTTTETIFNAEIILRSMIDRFGESKVWPRVAITTDEGSALDRLAAENNLKCVTIPKAVGGRWSVFSAVGLLPLRLAGINVEPLLDGASGMTDKVTAPGPSNLAITGAALTFLHYQAGRRIHDDFFFNPELESFGRWHRQLLAESIGKTKTDRSGKVGITPTISIGSTDLHSLSQLYIGGPDDRFTCFYHSKYQPSTPRTAGQGFFSSVVPVIYNQGAGEIMTAILRATEESYQQNNRPFASISLDDTSLPVLGSLFQLKMAETVYLGALFGVNVFDQPDVEAYKNATRKILEVGRN